MTYRKLATIVAVLLAVIVAAALWRSHNGDDAATDTGSSAPSSTTSSAPSASATATEPTPQPPEAGSPDAVAQQAMTIAHTWTPGIDTSPSDGFLRAAGYFTPRLAELITTNTGTDVPPSLQWENWTGQNARIISTTTIGCSGCPPDTANTAHRVATIAQTAVTAANTTPVEPETTIWLTLVRADTDTGWLIDELRY